MNRRASIGRGLALTASVLAIVGGSNQFVSSFASLSLLIRQPQLPAGVPPQFVSVPLVLLLTAVSGGVVAISLYVFVRTVQRQSMHIVWVVIVYFAAIFALVSFSSLFLPPVNIVNVVR